MLNNLLVICYFQFNFNEILLSLKNNLSIVTTGGYREVWDKIRGHHWTQPYWLPLEEHHFDLRITCENKFPDGTTTLYHYHIGILVFGRQKPLKHCEKYKVWKNWEQKTKKQAKRALNINKIMKKPFVQILIL